MKILLLTTAYNSLTQRTHIELIDRGHEVSIELALNETLMIEAVELYQPDIIITPFLKKAVPAEIWQNNICIIIHPGIKGDRGPSSLDWAIMNDTNDWGVTALQANQEMDAGDIWSSFNFQMRSVSKSSLYRNEVTEAAIKAMLETIERFASGNFQPEPLDYLREDVKGCWYPVMKQKVRQIDWKNDPVATIVKKIRSADSQPGVLDKIYGEEYYLYGAWEEEILKGIPGEIIAQRHGAICRAAVDGAVWISHLKKGKKTNQLTLKLPATMVLGEKIKNVPESPIFINVNPAIKTFKEIWYEEEGSVGYLHFNFYNGAQNTEQCQRLTEVFLYACSRPTKVIILMGGEDFWSNGIHLNVIEASDYPGDESWRNINAMNDLVLAILSASKQITIAAMRGNAAAGGVMLALAADLVYARSGIVLNPHYQRMGLYGSEYWTYLLPKRVGVEKALELTNTCMPMGTRVAKEIGLIDDDLANDMSSFQDQIKLIGQKIAESPDFNYKLMLKNKVRCLEEKITPLNQFREQELEKMRINFYGIDQQYHKLRYDFVHKIQPIATPLHLAKHRQSVTNELARCQIISPKEQDFSPVRLTS